MKGFYSSIALFIGFFGITNSAIGQCDTTTISGNFTQSNSAFLSGTYIVSGTFYLPAGVTVFVQPYSINGCGALEIRANKIVINGTIKGDYTGYTGGLGGIAGSDVMSSTGDIIALDNCNDKNNTGQVSLEGGRAGYIAYGAGGGSCGSNGQNGSGPKQQCLSTSDESGMIGGAGGAGGGGGGSYGGSGSNGGVGGNGTNSYQASGVNVSTGFVVIGGAGGTGGTTGNTYGTPAGTDISLGSGGGGGGGGGRSFYMGLNGNKGGAGGGMVKLFASDTLKIIGTISVNGDNGLAGGDGGNGGQSIKCCSDGCDDCGETTLSCGAGSGSGGGGGSGGGIYIETLNYAKITAALSSKGGNGGNAGNKGTGVTCTYSGGTFCPDQTITSGNGFDGNLGGGGGGGRIKIVVPNCSTSIITPVININGGTGNSNASVGTYRLVCTTVSVDEMAYHAFDLNIYPNPAQDEISIEFSNHLIVNSVSDFKIVDVSGREVKQETCKLTQNSKQTISISELSNGIYFVHLSVEGKNIHQKFIKN